MLLDRKCKQTHTHSGCPHSLTNARAHTQITVRPVCARSLSHPLTFSSPSPAQSDFLRFTSLVNKTRQTLTLHNPIGDLGQMLPLSRTPVHNEGEKYLSAPRALVKTFATEQASVSYHRQTSPSVIFIFPPSCPHSLLLLHILANRSFHLLTSWWKRRMERGRGQGCAARWFATLDSLTFSHWLRRFLHLIRAQLAAGFNSLHDVTSRPQTSLCLIPNYATNHRHNIDPHCLVAFRFPYWKKTANYTEWLFDSVAKKKKKKWEKKQIIKMFFL